MKKLFIISVSSLTLSLAAFHAQAGFEFVPGYSAPAAQQRAVRAPTQPVANNTLPVVRHAPVMRQQPYIPPQQSVIRSIPQPAQLSRTARPQPIIENTPALAPQQTTAAPVTLTPMRHTITQQAQTPLLQEQTIPQSASHSVPYEDYTQTTTQTPLAPVIPTVSVDGGIRTRTMAVVSDLDVYGDAYAPQRPRRREKKPSLFSSINPFPLGKKTNADDRAGLLFGRPVTVTVDSALPAGASTGPYMEVEPNIGPDIALRDVKTSIEADHGFLNQPIPQQQRPQPILPHASQNSDGSMHSANYAEVVGFGKEIPLSIALSQVIPNDYSLAYANGVSTDKNVSWEGGRPWNIVLDDMLSEKGLQAQLSGKTIKIAPFDQLSNNNIMTLDTISDSFAAGFYGLGNATAAKNLEYVTYDTTIRLWTAPTNATLRRIIETWASEAGVEVHWRADYDYPMQAPVSIQGTFEEALTTLLDGLSEANPRPVARLHPNEPDGPAVLVVQTRHVIR